MGNTEGAVELSVNAILATIDDFLKESGTRTHRALAGLEARATNVELWFQSAKASTSCTNWDSNFGSNYNFGVTP